MGQAMARKRKAKQQDSERWMVSYADLLTLMLAFFIVLYSQSMSDVSRLKEIAVGMISAFHGNPHVIQQDSTGNNGILKHHRAAIPVPKPAEAAHSPSMSRALQLRIVELNHAEKALRKVLSPMISNKQVHLSRQPLSLRIRLSSQILYPSGQARLTPSAQKLLTQVDAVLQQLPGSFPIVIQGYTNKRPIHNAQFTSNWELSTMRALSVVHLFRQDGMPGEQLSAQGFSKFHPIDKTDTPGALAANRRVDVLIEAPNTRSSQPRMDLKQMAHMTSTISAPTTQSKTGHSQSADAHDKALSVGKKQSKRDASKHSQQRPSEALNPADVSLSLQTTANIGTEFKADKLVTGSVSLPAAKTIRYIALNSLTRGKVANASGP